MFVSKFDQPAIELIVRVTDGSFESTLRLPVDSSEEERNRFARMWTGAMADAFKTALNSEERHELEAELEIQGKEQK